ncbi:MAG: UPF0182 family protein [Corynebacterium sp.]|nr:UPF0182 family protein [Corynebacterium sp.]
MATGFSTPPVRKPNRAVAGLIGAVVVLFILIPWVTGFYTDWLWFRSVNFDSVFVKTLWVRLALFVGVGLLAAAVTWLAGWIAFKNRPDELASMNFSPAILEYRKLVEQSLRKLLIIVPAVVGILAGLVGQASWRTVLFFGNYQDFGVTDPQFGRDLGFYAFTLPMLQLVLSGFSLLVGIAFFISLAATYLLGGVRAGNRATGEKMTITTPARIQLAVTAGVWMLLLVGRLWIDRFLLLNNQHTTFTGGNYTDINAVLPAKVILIVIGIVVAAAFFSAIVLKDLRIPAVATVLMILSSIVVGTAWPLLVDQFKVKPNGQETESPYIARNIEATRFAYGIGPDHVTYENDWGRSGPGDSEAVANDAATVSNIRILDPEVLSATFTQQQQLKNFYGFPESLAIDRYMEDGEPRDYVVAARELKPTMLADNQADWLNRHTVYTHGNGFVAAPANQVDEVAQDVSSTRGGYPVYTVADLQNMENPLGLTQPRTYFGPVISDVAPSLDYAIVGNNGSGQNFEYDADGVYNTYDGAGGVSIGNLINRAAYALKFQELNILLSNRIGGDSKILYTRNPAERVEKVAPWLTADSKVYPAVINGRIIWIVDAYTTLTDLPYAQRMSLNETTQDALTPLGNPQLTANQQVSYIRNSVKAVVDAYDGTVTLYAFDETDPVLKAWQAAFPGTVQPKSAISEELAQHLRYPEDLFKVQRELIAKYHVDDPGVFFNNDAFWSVPNDPSATDETRRALRQPPYYIVASDPQTGDASFQLITAFRGLEREYLAAHMSVTSDPDNYGKITVRALPTDSLMLGPKQVQDTMDSSDQVARDRSLWQNTNDVINGNLLTLPVGGGKILYVEPMYTKRKGQESAFPKLLRVLVSYGGRIGYAATVAEALSQVGIDPRAASDVDVAPAPAAAAPAPAAAAPSGSEGDRDAALKRISDAVAAVRTAQGGSFSDYGRALDELDAAVRDYQETYQ